MDEKEIIARNITYMRKKLGLSQVELADKIQYSNKNISKWEKGETTPSVFTLKQLAGIFGISVDEFVSVLQEEADVAKNGDEESITHSDEVLNAEAEPPVDKSAQKALPTPIRILYLLMVEAIILVLAFIAIIVLGLLDVKTFNMWLILLYVLPAMALAVFIFIICVKKRVDIISFSLFGWLLCLCFYVSFQSAPNVYLIFVLMGVIQLLIICVMLIINFKIISRIKNKFTKK